jgi:hypothetical protein
MGLRLSWCLMAILDTIRSRLNLLVFWLLPFQ